MGEKIEVHIASVSAPAIRALNKAIMAALAPSTAALSAPLSEAVADAYAGLDPWTRTAPEDSHTHPAGATLVAFLNGDARVVWVGAERVAEVPAGWRPLLVGPVVLPRSERLV